MTNININKLAYAVSATVGIFYSVCTALLVFLPEHALRFAAKTNNMTSLDIFKPFIHVTITSFIIGLIARLVLTYVFVIVVGYIYKMAVNKR